MNPKVYMFQLLVDQILVKNLQIPFFRFPTHLLYFESLCFCQYTLRRKSIGPFADFSYKMAIFKRLEKYLKVV